MEHLLKLVSRYRKKKPTCAKGTYISGNVEPISGNSEPQQPDPLAGDDCRDAPSGFGLSVFVFY
jgi:hypothetical protein